jgi:hypothetical protein
MLKGRHQDSCWALLVGYDYGRPDSPNGGFLPQKSARGKVALPLKNTGFSPIRPLKNGDLLRQRKKPDRLCMRNTLRVLVFYVSLHLTIFERPADFEFFNNQLCLGLDGGDNGG